MGSSSTGQRREVMALNTATNSPSMFLPAAAEVLGPALSRSWYMSTFLFLPVAAGPLQTQAGPAPAAQQECRLQPWDGAA